MVRNWLASLKVQLPRKFEQFAHNDATGGIIMMFCTVLALILQNGSYSTSYRHWLEMSAGVLFGDFQLIKPLLLWINDGLITIFFFSIGLELKIEFIKGHLSDRRNIILPSLGALAGIIFPSLFFIAFNFDNAYAMRGWAIPTSTDTAFSLALLMLLGSRVPASLKIFLLSMAIFDDIGAILVIALFYTSELSAPALILAGFALCCLLTLNYFGASRHMFYVFFGIIMWFAILKSGVHATLAGIITAFCIPMKDADNQPMVEPIFHNLKMWVSLLVLPVFTIANAGVDLSMIDLNGLFSPVSLGIFTGLFFGKQIGIFLVIWLCIKFRIVKMPEDATYAQIYGVCILTGIGFSMSMFIDTLAYQGSNVFEYADSLAILLASLCSGVFGYCFLRFYACRVKAIEYRPWLPAPEGYRGSVRTANLYALEEPIQGPASVAPTAILVAEAASRAAAARHAAEAAEEAAAAAQIAAEVAQKVAQSEEVDDKTVAEVQLAAAQAAQAAASAAVSTTKLDDSEENADTAEVAAAALEAAQAVADSAAEAVEEAEAAEAEAAEAEEKAMAEAVDSAKVAVAAETDDEAEFAAESVVMAVAAAQSAQEAATKAAESAETLAAPTNEVEASGEEKAEASQPESNQVDKAKAPDETEAEVEAETKAEAKNEAKTEAKDETKAEVKTETKVEPKAEAKTEAKDESKAEAKADDEGGVLSSMVDTTVKVAKAVTSLVKHDDEEADEAEAKTKTKVKEPVDAADLAEAAEQEQVEDDVETYRKEVVARAQAQVLQAPKQVKTDEELAEIRARAEAMAAAMAKPQATQVEDATSAQEPKASADEAESEDNKGLSAAEVGAEAPQETKSQPQTSSEVSALKVSEVLPQEQTNK